MLKAKLVVVGGDAKQAEVQLNLPTVIGRGREATLTVPHELVSRRHTEIIERDGQLFVRDLGSLNGTFVNSERIDGETPLMPNQLLTLGTITFRAIYDSGQSANVDTDEVCRETACSAASIDTIPESIDSLDAIGSAGKQRTIDPAQPSHKTIPVESLVPVKDPADSDTPTTPQDASALPTDLGSSAIPTLQDTEKQFDDLDKAPREVENQAEEQSASSVGLMDLVNAQDGSLEAGSPNADSQKLDELATFNEALGDQAQPNPDDSSILVDLDLEVTDEDSLLGSFLRKLPK